MIRLMLLLTWAMLGVVRTGQGRLRLTLAQVRNLPATIDVPTAASALGIGKSTLYEAIKLGASPVKVIIVQRRVVVLTADLVRVLEGGSSDAPAA